jgi:hypothetical protein
VATATDHIFSIDRPVVEPRRRQSGDGLHLSDRPEPRSSRALSFHHTPVPEDFAQKKPDSTVDGVV